MIEPADGPDSREREITSFLGYVSRSPAAKALIFVLAALIVVEVAWSGFRESVSKEYPITVGIVVSVLFVALGAVVVDLYLHQRNEQQDRDEQDQQLRTWAPIAQRIITELGSPLFELADAVYEAQMELWKAEVERASPDRDRLAQTIEDAINPVRTVLNQQLPTMLRRPDLRIAARRAEEACAAAGEAANLAREWNFAGIDDQQARYSKLKTASECVLNRRQWFQAHQAPPEEIAVKVP